MAASDTVLLLAGRLVERHMTREQMMIEKLAVLSPLAAIH
jgi:hypothetical protein